MVRMHTIKSTEGHIMTIVQTAGKTPWTGFPAAIADAIQHANDEAKRTLPSIACDKSARDAFERSFPQTKADVRNQMVQIMNVTEPPTLGPIPMN